MTATATSLVCPLSLTPPLPHRLHLVRVEKLAASHDGEEVRVGPQADTHASSSAASRQPSATVADSRSAASQAMGEADWSEATAHAAGATGGVAHSDVPMKRQLPKAVLDELPSLSHQPRRLPVIADGRCSVAVCSSRMRDDR